MIINTESVELLIKILEKDFLDEYLYDTFIRTKGVKGFLNHQNTLGQRGVEAYIKEELKRVVEDESYEDLYEFYKLKNSLKQLKLDIQYINENSHQIIQRALKKVYKIVPKDMPIRSNIYLYCGGIDGGFTINRNNIFINYGKYLGEKEEFIKILSHEMYHSRKLPIENRILLLFRLISRENRLLFEIIGKIIEKGIACLVQHGPKLEKDDLTGNLTKRSLLLARDEFELMNNIITDIKSGKTNNLNRKHLNIYVIGYMIVSYVYREKGVFILDDWTVNLNFKRIIKEYIELCSREEISSGFNNGVLEWIIK